MKTFYQICSIQIDTVLSEYMTCFANTMASRIFFTEEVVIFSWKTWKQNLITYYEPLVECSNEKFEYLEE